MQVLGPAPNETTMPVAAGDQVPTQQAAAATTTTQTLPDGTVININIGKFNCIQPVITNRRIRGFENFYIFYIGKKIFISQV